MNRKAGKTQIDVSRRLLDTTFSLKVYSVWAILAFLVFGLMGIYPQARILSKSIRTSREMQEIDKSLRNKIDLLNQEALKIENNDKGIKALEKALPADYEVQNYIVNLSFAVSKAGYDLVGLRAEKVIDAGQGVVVSAELEGNGNIGELIKSIESLDRAAQVNQIKFVEKSDRKEITCSLDIYVLK
jgi:voltage-gated potassium channel Kch